MHKGKSAWCRGGLYKAYVLTNCYCYRCLIGMFRERLSIKYCMKNIVLPALVLMLLFSAVGCSSGHYVSAQPEGVVVTRPAPPYPNYIWMGGNYYWRGGRYMYRPGYWVAPRAHRVYRPGRWIKTPRGYYWHRGGWRR